MSSTFEDKKKLLFDTLDSAEKNLKGSVIEQSTSTQLIPLPVVPKHVSKHAKIEFGKYRNKESLFKAPPPVLSKCLKPRRPPDHQVNPNKWKHYSLADVDISDHTNQRAAYSFLQEIEERKQNNDDHDMSSGSFKKIQFNKSVKLREKTEEDPDQNTSDHKKRFINNKMVMPQYEMGQKKEKPKTVSKRSLSKEERQSKQMRLDHLMEEEDDEDN